MKRVALVFLTLLFLILSFNAYACLLPVPVGPAAPMEQCPSSGPATSVQFCDIFKTSAFHSHPDGQDSFPFASSIVPITTLFVSPSPTRLQSVPVSSQTRSIVTSMVLRI